ncbi:sensor histidine kinase [Saccharopolyspora flava]|uniref:histidine kinase n=1 Tax=Saccharopolyspora flava TaxID=95161 RepID=A0A1I6QFS2_9PSEU|nr:histidine kinase [Saccharopolyspora flava]SFS51331.1 Signal transduction histidine kinase [Saccharopolyspora flava]
MEHPWWRLLWNDRREAVFDIALVVGLHVFVWTLGRLYPGVPGIERYDWIGGLWLAHLLNTALGIGLLARRRYPMALLWPVAVISVAQALLIAFGPGPFLQINLPSDPWAPGLTPLVVYAAVVYQRRARWLMWVLIGFVTLVCLRPWTFPDTDTVLGGALWSIVPVLLGLSALGLRDRAERAEREQELRAEQARADERARLAVEMHDVVTHRINLMVLQAGALAVAGEDPAVRRAAEELRASGSQALTELRDLVGVLRRSETEPQDHRADPPASLPDLDELVAQSEAVGMSVRFTVDGRPGPVTSAVARTAYRVVQEGLTNAHKHAPGAHVDVRVLHSDDRVRVLVRNTATAGPREPNDSGGGVGLLGLQQRVELVGGTFRAEPVDGGGFEVEAILPGYVPTEESADA